MRFYEKAYAKINLSLDVIAKRDDGYHELEMIMQTLAFCDALVFELNGSGKITFSSNLRYLPRDGRNLCVAAASAFYSAANIACNGLHIKLEKRIPVCAGLGGGSSDAAAVLRALNRAHGRPFDLQGLQVLAAEIGSDVAFCVAGGTQLARGRGEVLTRLPPVPACYTVLCKPHASVSTARVFGSLKLEKINRRPDTQALCKALDNGDLQAVARGMVNVLAEASPPPELEGIISALNAHGALGAAMSGSGPTAFGLFDSNKRAAAAATALRRRYRSVFITSVKGEAEV